MWLQTQAYKLSKTEVLQLLNLAPTSLVEVYLVTLHVVSRAIDFLNAADSLKLRFPCRLSKTLKPACKKVTLNSFWHWCNST